MTLLNIVGLIIIATEEKNKNKQNIFMHVCC